MWRLSGPQASWRSPENANGNGSVDGGAVAQAKSSERAGPKQVPKTNGFREEHNHRGNGYISITGTWRWSPVCGFGVGCVVGRMVGD